MPTKHGMHGTRLYRVWSAVKARCYGKNHPTYKNYGARLIRNSSRKGETVLDLFCGSGSTIIACEQMGRKCRAVELDPHYADVTIERWERFTGKSAELIGMVE